MPRLWGSFKRVISMLLILTIMLPTVQIPAFAATNSEAVYLPHDEIDEETCTNGTFYLGSSGAEIPEDAGVPYLFKIGRGGSDLPEAEVRLNFIDITAKYGDDYKIKIHGGPVFGGSVRNADSGTSLLEEISENRHSIVEENYSDGIVSQDTRDIDTLNEDYQEDIDLLDEFLSEQVEGYEDEKEAYIDANGGNSASGTDMTDISSNENAAANSLKAAKELATGLKSDKTPMDGGNSSLADYTQEILSDLSLELESAYLIVGFAQGETEKYVEIIPQNNTRGDGDRMFSVNMFSHSPDAAVSGYSGLSVIILDDEEQAPASVSFTDAEYYPDNGFIEVTVERTGAINQMVSVDIATQDVTALAGRDYSQVDTSLVFPYGITTRTVKIPVRSDYLDETVRFSIFLSCAASCVIGEIDTAYGVIAPDSVSYELLSFTDEDTADTMVRADATVTSYITGDEIDLEQSVTSAGVDWGGHSNAKGKEWEIYTKSLSASPANAWAGWTLGERYDVNGVAIDWTKTSRAPCYTSTLIYDSNYRQVWDSTVERWGRKTTDIYFHKNDMVSTFKIEQVRKGAFYGTSPTLTIHSIKPILRPFEITLREAEPLEFLNENGIYVPNTQISEVMDANHSILQNASNSGKGTVVKFSGDSFTVTSNSKYSYIQGLKIVNKSTGTSKLICSNLAVGTTSVSVELTNDFLIQYSDYVTYSDNGQHGRKGAFTVQPVMGYYDSTVTINKDYRGQIGYVDGDGRVPVSEEADIVILSYHKGDTLRFTQTLDPTYSSSYTGSRIRMITKATSTADPADNKRAYDKGTNYCTILNEYSDIDVYPNFDKKDNQIVVRVAKSDLESFDMDTGIFLSPAADAGAFMDYTVVGGDIFAAGVYYELSAKAANSEYTPVWQIINKDTKYSQETFYFEATGEVEQNIIHLTCQKTDSMAYVLAGKAYYSNVALNGGQEGTAWMPASNIHVMIGPDKFGLSDENGCFNTVGMYGISGMSVIYKIIASGKISYQTAVLSNKNISDFGSSGAQVQAYKVDVGTIKADAVNHAAPYVTALVATNTEGVESGVVSINDNITMFTVALNNNGAAYTDSDGTVRTEKVTAVDLLVYEKQSHQLKSTISGAKQGSDANGMCIWTCSATFLKGQSSSYSASDELYVRVTTDRVVGNGKGYNAQGEEVELDALKQTLYAPVNTGYTFVEENRQEPVTHDIDMNTDMNFVQLPLIGDMQASFNIKKISLSVSALPNGGQRLAVGFVPAKTKPSDTGKIYKLDELEKAASDTKKFGEKMRDKGALGMSSWGIAPVFGIYLDFGLKNICTDDIHIHKLVFIGGGVYLGATGNFRLVQYFVLGWVPCYMGVDGVLTAFMQAGIKANNEDSATVDSIMTQQNALKEHYELAAVLQANGIVSAYVGAGLCGTLGIRGGISFSANYIWQAMYPEYSTNGLILSAGIKVWVDAFLFSVPIPAVNLAGVKYGYFKEIDYDETSSRMPTQSIDQLEITLKPRNTEITQWLPDGQAPGFGSTFEPVVSTVLMENGYDRADPQLIDLGGGRILLVFLADDPNRSDVERTALMYSVYNNDKWSAPVMVQNDGTADFEPNVCDAGDKVIISWTSREPGSNYTTETEYLKSLNVYTTTLTKETLTLGTIEQLTDDAFYDYAPTAIYDSESGNYLVYYLKAEVGTDFERAVSSTTNGSMIVYMLYDAAKGEWARDYYYDNELQNTAAKDLLLAHWGGQRFLSSPIVEFEMNDPVIIDFDAISYNGLGVYAYTVDEDNNMDTIDDRELFVQFYDFATHTTHLPVRITNNNLSDAMPQLIKNGEHTYLFWLENHENILYIDISALIDFGITDDGAIKTQIEYDKDYHVGQEDKAEKIYEMHPEVVFFTKSEGIDVNPTFGSYKAFVDGKDNLFITWLQPVTNEDGSSSQEIYASALIKDPNGSSWSEGVRLTNSDGRFNDEVSVITDDKGDLLTVSNQYSMDLTDSSCSVKDIKLVATKFKTVGSLEIDTVEYSNDAPQAGSTVNVTAKIKNTGLKSATGYTVKVFEVLNGVTQTEPFCVVPSQNHITPSSSDFVTFEWTMPESYQNVNELSLRIEVQEAEMAETESYLTESIKIQPVYRILSYSTEQRADGFYATYSIENIGNIDAEFPDPSAGDKVVIMFNDIYHKNAEAAPYLEAPIGSLKINEVQTCVTAMDIPGKQFEFGYTNAYMEVRDVNNNSLSSRETFIIPLEHPYQIIVNDDENLTEIVLEEGDRLQMRTAYSPSDFFMDADINYNIKDASIAYMEDGKLVANNVGETELTVMIVPYGGYKNIKVVVKEKTFVPPLADNEVWFTITPDTNGGNTMTPIRVKGNTPIGEIETPVRDGYAFDGWYLDKELTKRADLSERVTSSITLYAKWIEKADTEWTNPFTDVMSDDWFYESVKYANRNGLFGGMTDTTFGPHEKMTRAMLVTVLYRAENTPAVSDAAKFTDVPQDAYYAAAVAWAQANGIVNGLNETEFAPDVNITREQIAAIMYRYAVYKGVNTVTLGENLAFTDAESISPYAVSAMNWIAGQGIITGYEDDTVRPQDHATRAETAAVLQRFLEKLDSMLKSEQ